MPAHNNNAIEKEHKVDITLLPTWNRQKESKTQQVTTPSSFDSEKMEDVSLTQGNGKVLIFIVVVVLVAWYLFPHTILLELWSFATIVVGVYYSFIKK